jgi:hypothetical protein
VIQERRVRGHKVHYQHGNTHKVYCRHKHCRTLQSTEQQTQVAPAVGCGPRPHAGHTCHTHKQHINLHKLVARHTPQSRAFSLICRAQASNTNRLFRSLQTPVHLSCTRSASARAAASGASCDMCHTLRRQCQSHFEVSTTPPPGSVLEVACINLLNCRLLQGTKGGRLLEPGPVAPGAFAPLLLLVVLLVVLPLVGGAAPSPLCSTRGLAAVLPSG